jgi:hypothetical protein
MKPVRFVFKEEVGYLFSPGQKKTGTGMFNTVALAGYQKMFCKPKG